MENEKEISINDITVGGTYKFRVSGHYYGNDDRMKELEGKWFVGLLTDKRTDGINDDFVVFDIIKPRFKLGDDTDVYIGLNFWDKLEIMTYNPYPDKLEAQGRNVITVCGSIRFAKLMNEISQNLIKSGHAVMCPNCYNTPANDKWINKVNLVNLHKQMIDISDELYVVNSGGYIGETTSELILYAEELGKRVEYYVPIEPVVKATAVDDSLDVMRDAHIKSEYRFDESYYETNMAYRVDLTKMFNYIQKPQIGILLEPTDGESLTFGFVSYDPCSGEHTLNTLKLWYKDAIDYKIKIEKASFENNEEENKNE